MANENEQVVEEQIVEEDLSKLDDTTDWKAKAQELEQKRREEGIRNRERTKALREQLKGLEKSSEKVENKDSSVSLEKMERLALRLEGITHPDDIDLARKTAKKWGMEIDEVASDEDFKVKLERQRNSRANAEATSNVRGGGGGSESKSSADYWIAKGVVPTREQLSDRKTRVAVARALMNSSKSGKKFYND